MRISSAQDVSDLVQVKPHKLVKVPRLFRRPQIKSILQNAIIRNGQRAGCHLAQITVKQYTSAFKRVYKVLRSDIFVAQRLEEWARVDLQHHITSLTAVGHIANGVAVPETTRNEIQQLCGKLYRELREKRPSVETHPNPDRMSVKYICE